MPKGILFIIVFIQTIVICAFPDTSKIPAKWNKESIVILEFKHTYSVYFTKNTKEEIKTLYFIRDKWGLDELSVLNLPTDIEGNLNEKSIGTVYKRDGTTIPISKENLIPRKTTIDFSNSSSQFRKGISIEASNSQKLAVPSLEVGDVLELNYTSESSHKPSVMVLTNKFPILHFETKVYMSELSGFGGVTMALFAKKMNTEVEFETENDSKVAVVLDSLDKYKDEILNDENKQIPYLLIGYKYKDYGAPDQSSNTKYKSMDKLRASAVQIAMVRDLYSSADKSQKSVASRISSSLQKKYPKITDTVAYVS
ncbi:MAG TPA: hypothetical protein VNX68_05215, partial [Nitrosopumilaceae archaeon]|nr:hypothetical protein [Nitrosopumilaceae archaeon]